MYLIDFIKSVYFRYKGYRDGKIAKKFISKYGDKYISCVTCLHNNNEKSIGICEFCKKRSERFGDKVWIPNKKLRKSVNF